MTFALTILFMLLVFWRPQEWLVPILFGWPILDIIVYMALLSLLLENQQGRARIPVTPTVGLLVGLFVASIMSHVPHTYFQGILDTIPETFKPCFFALLLLTVTNTLGRARVVAGVIVLMGCVMAVHALMQQRTGYGFSAAPPIWIYTPEKGWYSRSLFFGIFGDPNDLAQFLAACIPLAFAVPRRLSFFSFLAAAAAATLLVMGLLTTHSRGGTVALIAVGGLLVFLRLPIRWMPWLAALGLLGFLVACSRGGAGMLDASARERVVFWGYANWAFKQNPIFGIGYGMFWQISEDRAAHNAFVHCYTEMGLVGYWFWFNLLLLGVIGCWRTRMAVRKPRTPEQRHLRRLAGMGLASMAGFSAGAYFLSRTFVFPFFFLFALLNAVPLIARNLLPSDHPPLIDTRRDVLVYGTIATLASVVYIYVSILLLNR